MRCVDCAHEAVERCEVTGAPLCAEHLWYIEDGRRVSERVARHLAGQGARVIAPKTYLERLGTSAPLPRLPSSPVQPRITRQREQNEVVGRIAAVCGGVSAASCAALAVLPCCLPVPMLSIVLGVVSMLLAPTTSAPRRMRLLGIVGVIGGVLPIVLSLAVVLFERNLWGIGVP